MEPFSPSRQLNGLNGLILDSSLVFALVEFVVVPLIALLLFAARFICEYSKQMLRKHERAGLCQSCYNKAGLTQSRSSVVFRSLIARFVSLVFHPNGEKL